MTELLAQYPNINEVPADFVKNFILMLAFVAGAGGVGFFCYHRGRKQSGSATEPVHVAQPLEVKRHKEYAHKDDMDSEFARMREQITSMSRENIRQHRVSEDKLQALLSAGSKRGEDIMAALHNMETRIVKTTLGELKDIHQRINPIERQLGEHEGKIKSLTTAIAEIRDWFTRFFTTKPRA